MFTIGIVVRRKGRELGDRRPNTMSRLEAEAGGSGSPD